MSDLDELGRLARECVARADIERRHADEFNIPLPANDRENLARALLDVLPVVRAAEALRDSGHDYDCPFLTTDCLATCTVDAARFALGKAVDTLRTQLKERQ